MPVRLIDGDVLDTDADALMHQTNVTTRHAKHMAGAVFDKWPGADTYSSGRRRTLGTVDVTFVCRSGGGPMDLPGLVPEGPGRTFAILNLNAQKGPGIPRPCMYAGDNKENRLAWFRECLEHIKYNNPVLGFKTIAAPWRIGCGAAGGDWRVYFEVLRTWSVESGIDVLVYMKDLSLGDQALSREFAALC